LYSKQAQKTETFFVVFFSPEFGRKNTTCGADHQLHVGLPGIFIRQPGDSEAGDSALLNRVSSYTQQRNVTLK
jgi:hypothetical protein